MSTMRTGAGVLVVQLTKLTIWCSLGLQLHQMSKHQGAEFVGGSRDKVRRGTEGRGVAL